MISASILWDSLAGKRKEETKNVCIYFMKLYHVYVTFVKAVIAFKLKFMFQMLKDKQHIHTLRKIC